MSLFASEEVYSYNARRRVSLGDVSPRTINQPRAMLCQPMEPCPEDVEPRLDHVDVTLQEFKPPLLGGELPREKAQIVKVDT